MVDLGRVSLQDLEKELKRREACKSKPKRNLILLGAPGSGKGTQSTFLINEFCYCQLSTGDLLREAVANKTPVGLKAKEAMDKGQLVSDEIVNNLIVDSLRSPKCERGAIFDGYPRNQQQAENLDKLLSSEGKKLDTVIELTVDEDILVERVEGRRIHQPSGRTYHIKFNPPKVEGKDDVTGEDLIHRNDDKREVLKSRLDVYNSKTKPISSYYKSKGILRTVNAMDKIDNVKSNVQKFLL